MVHLLYGFWFIFVSVFPSYANLFVGYVEKQIFEQYTGLIPDFFGRYCTLMTA